MYQRVAIIIKKINQYQQSANEESERNENQYQYKHQQRSGEKRRKSAKENNQSWHKRISMP